MDAKTVRVEVEMSRGWATSYPDLAFKSYEDFIRDYGNTNWTLSVDDSRQGFVTLTARRREP